VFQDRSAQTLLCSSTPTAFFVVASMDLHHHSVMMDTFTTLAKPSNPPTTTTTTNKKSLGILAEVAITRLKEEQKNEALTSKTKVCELCTYLNPNTNQPYLPSNLDCQQKLFT